MKKHVNLENIPDELKKLNRWVIWSWTKNQKGEPTKVPIDAGEVLALAAQGEEPRYYKAKSNDPYTWTTFEQAVAALQIAGSGLGIMLGDDLIGIDWDDCCDGEKIRDDVAADLARLNTYAEISPSGKGIKAIALGTIPRGRKSPDREIYNNGRFFTVTGCKVTGSRPEARQDAIDDFYRKYFPERPEPSRTATETSITLEDREIVLLMTTARNGEFSKALWNLDEAVLAAKFRKSDGSPDWSSCVTSLVSRLAFFTQSADQIDRIFRSSKLHNRTHWCEGKWDRLGASIIQFAISGLEDVYKKSEQIEEIETFDYQPTKPEPVEYNSEEHVEQPRHKGKIMRLQQLFKLPSPKWQIEDHFTEKSFVTIFGASGSYKSFVAIEMALSVALGRKYLNRWNVKKGKVLYIISEGQDSFKKRIQAWLKKYNVEEIPEDILVAAWGYDFGTDDSQAVDILDECRELWGSLPDLIIIDTLSRNFGPHDPNSPKDMQRFCSTLDYMRYHADCSTIAVHHTGWAITDRERSASNLRDSADTSIQVTKSDGLRAKIEFKKQKDSDEMSPYFIAADVVDIGDDSLSSSLVFRISAEADTDKDQKQLIGLLEQVLDERQLNQRDLITVIKNMWTGKAPIESVLTSMLKGLIGEVLVTVPGKKKEIIYKLI